MIFVPRTENRILNTIPKNQWMEKSLFVEKDRLGNPSIKTYFRIRARLSDGHVCWAGWYEDRDDFDAVLFAIASGSLKYERSLWKLSSPEWNPGLSEIESYDFAATTFITAPTGSNQTYNVPSDWSNSNNSIECLGAGGSGASMSHTASGIRWSTGGGGGGYGKYTNLTLTAGGTATYRIGTGGTAVSASGGSNGTTGNAGGDTWFNGTTYSGASVGGVGGGAGAFSFTAATNGGAGGGGKGTSSNTGGRGGNINVTAVRAASGGGGAAGLNGNGLNGVDSTGQGATNGGAGDNGLGGAGGVGANALTGNAGGNGTEWSASYGSGGGGGGLSSGNLGGAVTNGAGGSYGGGSGGTGTVTNTANGGAGSGGLIVITYEPVLILGNMPMLGM